MKIQVTMCGGDVYDVASFTSGMAVRDLKPTARKNHLYEITLPDDMPVTIVPSQRLGHYGHTEYVLDDIHTLCVGRFYDGILATINKKQVRTEKV